jgi:hypothetical protein
MLQFFYFLFIRFTCNNLKKLCIYTFERRDTTHKKMNSAHKKRTKHTKKEFST